MAKKLISLHPDTQSTPWFVSSKLKTLRWLMLISIPGKCYHPLSLKKVVSNSFTAAPLRIAPQITERSGDRVCGRWRGPLSLGRDQQSPNTEAGKEIQVTGRQGFQAASARACPVTPREATAFYKSKSSSPRLNMLGGHDLSTGKRWTYAVFYKVNLPH